MAQQKHRQVAGVLLDVDGTLIGSNGAHARSWSEALKAFGRDVPAERVRPLIGMGGDKLLPELLGVEPDSETGEKFAELRARIFLERPISSRRLSRKRNSQPQRRSCWAIRHMTSKLPSAPESTR